LISPASPTAAVSSHGAAPGATRSDLQIGYVPMRLGLAGTSAFPVANPPADHIPQSQFSVPNFLFPDYLDGDAIAGAVDLGIPDPASHLESTTAAALLNRQTNVVHYTNVAVGRSALSPPVARPIRTLLEETSVHFGGALG
jgi:hypothetical protein